MHSNLAYLYTSQTYKVGGSNKLTEESIAYCKTPYYFIITQSHSELRHCFH